MMDPPTDGPLQPAELLEHVAFVRKLARGLVRDEHAVDDVVQQSFLKAIKSPPRHRGNLRSWFAVVVRNVVYRDTDRRRLARDVRAAVAEPDGAVEATDRATERADFQRMISATVHELPEPFRTVLVMRYFDELSTDEIAERLGVPRETVRSRQRRGLARMRERLAREDERRGGNWRVSAFALLGEELPVTGISLTVAGGWLLAAAVLVPLIALGGAFWKWGAHGPTPSEATLQVQPGSSAYDARSNAGSTSVAHDRSGQAARTPLVALARVRATVIADEDGKPLAGARLVVARRVAGEWAVATARSDDRGLCTGPFRDGEDWPVDADLTALLEPGGPQSFAVLRAEGRAPWRSVRLPSLAQDIDGAQLDLGVLRLVRGVPVRGRVTHDDTGAPAVGAVLWLSDDSGDAASVARAVRVGQCEADGRFLLDELVAPNRSTPYTWSLFAELEGQVGWKNMILDPLASELSIELVLGPYAALDLELRGEDGVSVEGALVRLQPLHTPWSRAGAQEYSDDLSRSALGAPFETLTDARGLASFDHLPARDRALPALRTGGSTPLAGPFSVSLRLPGEDRERVLDSFGLPTGERTLRVVELAQLYASGVRGLVRASRDGRILRDAWVRDVHGAERIVVDGEGGFRLPRSFSRKIEVGAPGHLTRVLEWGPSAAATRLCSLDEALAVRGSVSDPLGVVLEDVRVRAAGGAQSEAGVLVRKPRQFETRTDASGRFEFHDLPAGRFIVTVEVPPGGPWRPPLPLDVEAGAEALHVVLEPDLGVGRDVHVTLHDAAGGGVLRALDAELQWRGEGAPPAPSALDSRGERVMLTNVRPGSWRLWARISGRGAALLDFEVTPGDEPLELELLCGGWCRIEGRVALPAEAGTPRDWIVASVFQGPAPPRRWPTLRQEYGSRGMRAYVLADGSFAMDTVVAGPYRLELLAADWTGTARIDVLPGSETHVELAAQRAGTLILRGALPIPVGLSIHISDGAGGQAWHWLRPTITGAGWEVRRDLPSGEQRWALALRSPPGSPRPLPPTAELTAGRLQIEAGETHVVEVVLPE